MCFENVSPDIIAVNITQMTIATIAVLLRLVSRRIKVTPLEADDFTITPALAEDQISYVHKEVAIILDSHLEKQPCPSVTVTQSM